MFRSKPFAVQLAGWLVAIAFAVQPCLAGPCGCGTVSKHSTENDSHRNSQPAHRDACCCDASKTTDSSLTEPTCCCCDTKNHVQQTGNDSACACNIQSAPSQPAPTPASAGAPPGAEKSLQPAGFAAIDLQNQQQESQIRNAAYDSPASFASAAEH